MPYRLVVWLIFGLLGSPCLGEVVRDYGYPFADPYEATVLGTPEQDQAPLPATIPLQVRELLVERGHEVPEIFWYAARLRYSLAAQPGPAPLVFVVPGTGANFDASKSLILQRALYRAGFHVASLPSPLHQNFIVSASTSSRPGLLAEDARDLYRALKSMRPHIENEVEVTWYGLVGYSLGATDAAFVARLDSQERSFDFEKVLLINPPVNLHRSAGVLDQLFAENIPSIAALDALLNELVQELAQFYSPAQPVTFSEDLVYAIYRHHPPPDRTLEALIGAAFRLASMNLIFTADVMAHLGVLVAPDRRLGVTDTLTPYLKASTQISFDDYAHRVLYPYYRESAPDVTFEQLVAQDSLRAIGDYLRSTPKIGLMHNADDILLSEGDLEYLETVFGERARIYPKGGHCGNLAYKDNIAYLTDFFTGGRGHR